jgi:hypothetical protein
LREAYHTRKLYRKQLNKFLITNESEVINMTKTKTRPEKLDVSVKLPKGLYGELLLVSERDNIPLDDLVTEIIEDYFAEEESPESNPEDNPE